MAIQPPLTPEVLVPKLGDYLVTKGLISAAELKRALAFQKSLRADDQIPPLLGNILIQMGLITREKLDEVITEQILQLREALQRYNQQLEHRVQERTAELELALSKLSELNKLKANFIANVSHELRTPLTHLKGYLELLTTSSLGPLTAEQNEALTTIQRSTERLEQLIESLILFATAEKEEFSLAIRPFPILPTCQKVIKKLKEKAENQKVTIHLDCPADLPMAKADEEKISWAILQLLDNSIKFTPAGGHVNLQCLYQNPTLRIIIKDTGIGIPEEKFKELFEAFHQLDGSSTRRYGGTGLGLALVKKIVEAHGTTIHFNSVVGKGSQFEFDLPAQTEKPSQSHASPFLNS